MMLFILIVLIPSLLMGMEYLGDANISCILHLENNKTFNISSETATWLELHSGTIQDMKADISDYDNNLHLPDISLTKFELFKNKIIDKKSDFSFKALCKKPLTKDLTTLLHVALYLDIAPLQDAITTEIATRYYNFPSLARRHSSQHELYKKYIPSFKNTAIEKLVAEKIIELSKTDGKIEHITTLSSNVKKAWLTANGTRIIGEFKGENYYSDVSWSCFAVWDAATGQLSEELYQKKYSHVIPTISTNGTYLLTWGGNKIHHLKDFKGNTLTTIKSEEFLLRLGNIHSLQVNPNNTTFVAVDYGHIIIMQRNGSSDKSWKDIYLYINSGKLDQGYTMAFNNYPLLTRDGKYLIYKYRLGIIKLNLETEKSESFDFISKYTLNDEVSALALTPDESHIIVGICKSTCKTKVKILDFQTGKVTQTIPINNAPYCRKNDDDDPEKGWPFEYISTIAATNNKVIVASKCTPTKIINLDSGNVQNLKVAPNAPHASSNGNFHPSFVSIPADDTKIIAGYHPLALYELQYKRLATCLTMARPLQQMLSILGGTTASTSSSGK